MFDGGDKSNKKRLEHLSGLNVGVNDDFMAFFHSLKFYNVP